MNFNTGCLSVSFVFLPAPLSSMTFNRDITNIVILNSPCLSCRHHPFQSFHSSVIQFTQELGGESEPVRNKGIRFDRRPAPFPIQGLDDNRETTPLVEKFQESDQFRFQCVTSALCPSVALCSSIFEVHMLFCTSQSKRDFVFYTAPAGEQNFFSFPRSSWIPHSSHTYNEVLKKKWIARSS